jgi:hypothetical protein
LIAADSVFVFVLVSLVFVVETSEDGEWEEEEKVEEE